MSDRVVIVGAGVGGLSAAIRLAAAGRRALVLEKNDAVGGKMSRLEADGFRWDTGPSVITMRHVLEELFSSAGARVDAFLDLVEVEPLTRYVFADGTSLDASRDPGAMETEIRLLAGARDAAGYQRYLEYARHIHRVTGPVFIYDRPPTWRSFLRVPPWDWRRADPLRTMSAAVDGFVRDERLRMMLKRFATYVGSDPYRAPATLNVIGHVELSGGVWYPLGGVYAIAEALARVARSLGVDIRTGCAVRSIDVEGGRVAGVTTAEGERIPATQVISNVDAAVSRESLLGESVAVSAREPSCSGFILFLGVRGEHKQLAHHNVFFSGDYRAEFNAVFGDGRPSPDPTTYVAITSKTDASHAPPGHENWFVLVNVPALGGRVDWAREAPAYRDLVLDRLASRGVDIRDRVVIEAVWTPEDLRGHTGAWRGALYGPSSNARAAAFSRQPNRARSPRGLYFAGGTAHPGGGVPMVMLSGKAAAEMVLSDTPAD